MDDAIVTEAHTYTYYPFGHVIDELCVHMQLHVCQLQSTTIHFRYNFLHGPHTAVASDTLYMYIHKYFTPKQHMVWM